MGFEKHVKSIVDVVEENHIDDGHGNCKECGDAFPCDCVALVELVKALLMRCTSYCVAVDHASAQLAHMAAMMQAANLQSRRSHGEKRQD
jgi:hypothetical protein